MAEVRDTTVRLRPLLLSRAADQGALALSSLAMAVVLGPDRYAVIAVVLVVASMSVQLSDVGLGFALMSRGGDPLSRRTASRLRHGNALLALVAVVAAAALVLAERPTAALLVGFAGLVWAATGEAFVRRSAALVHGQASIASRAELLASAALVLGAAVAAATAEPAVFALALLARYAVEACLLPDWEQAVTDDAPGVGLPLEWLSQAVTFATANVDYAIVAVAFGADALSIYSVGYRTASVAFALIANPLTQRALVELGQSVRTGATELREAVDRTLTRHLRAGLVACVVAVTAAPIVTWVLDPSWDATLGVTVILAAALPTRLLVGPAVALGLAAGRRGLVVSTELARAGIMVAAGVGAVAVGASLIGVTIALTAATIVGATFALGAVLVLADVPFSYRLLAPALTGVVVSGVAWVALSP